MPESDSLRIAVLSDTHDRLPQQIFPISVEADEIWHLGDVCDRRVITELESLGLPMRVVRGNCDGCAEWPWSLNLSYFGIRYHLEHIPDDRFCETDVFLHGHTHVPRFERTLGVLRLNPGALSRPRNGSRAGFAWLTLRDGQPPDWRRIAI